MSDLEFDPIDPVLGEFQIHTATLPPGGHAGGTIRIEPHGVFAHSVATLTDGTVRYGLAALFQGRLAIATGPLNKVEIGAYRLQGDRLEGIWVPPGAKGCDLSMCGREISHRDTDSSFTIDRAYAIDQMPYTGRLTLDYIDPPQAALRRVKFNWTLHDGNYASFGLASGDVLLTTFNFEPNTPYAIGLYDPRGESWEGTIAHSDFPEVTRETLHRS